MSLLLLLFSVSSLQAVLLKVARPFTGEDFSLPIGYTVVVGTVEPANSKVFCNGTECQVEDDGAFLGFVPIKSLKEWVTEKDKKCDLQFEFVAQNGSDEEKKTVLGRSPRTSPPPAMELFSSPKTIQINMDQWIGLEGTRLGDIIFCPKGSLLQAKAQEGDKYRCDVGDSYEITIPKKESKVVQKDEKELVQEYLITSKPNKDIKLVSLLDSMTISLVSNVWGVNVLKDENGFRFETQKGPKLTGSEELKLEGVHICIDPGHFPDRGAIGPRGFEENKSTLLISQEMGEILKKKGAQVSFTREENPLPLKERYQRIRELKPDLVVSVHNNSVGDGEDPRLRHGTQTFYLHPWSKPLAEAVHAAMLKGLGTSDLGCIRRNLYITRILDCPSILIEPEYIILPSQEKKFMDPEYRRKLAEAVVNGIEEFVRNTAKSEK